MAGIEFPVRPGRPRPPDTPVASVPERRKVGKPTPRFSPEQETLLLCARTTPDRSAAARLRDRCRSGLDWSLLCRTATAHGTMPLLYGSLSAECPDLVPAATLEQLRAAYYFNQRRNRLTSGELLRLLERLGDRGIAAAPFKGPALACWAYGGLGQRQFRDLDLLVHHEDFLAARDLLVAEGYRPLYHASGEHETDHLLSHYASEFISADRKFRVDLHRGFARRFSFLGPEPADLWRRLRPVALEDLGEVLTFSQEDTLLVLALHGSKHGWSELKQICDLAQFVAANPELDWDRVLSLASKSGLRKMLLVGLGLSHQLLGATLPEAALERIRSDRQLAGLARLFQGRLFAGAGASGDGADPDWRLALLDGWPSRARYWWESWRYRLAPTQKDWSLVRFPRPLRGLYYLVRPARVAGQLTRRAWRG